MSGAWVLCVDDDERLLSGLELQLGFDFDVVTATSGQAGLAELCDRTDCSVIISDMRMPGMNGAEFLAKARVLVPDATRMLLTGFSDVADTVSAVNDGGIFRFLTKPIGPDALVAAVNDGVRQWELIRSERILLEETLNGAAQALIEALEIASPETFARVRRIEDGCRHVATDLGLTPVWEVALAGLLSRIGWIAVPADVISEHLAGNHLSDAARLMIDDALRTTVRLVSRVPRLDRVSAIIEAAAALEQTTPTTQPQGPAIPASVLYAVTDFDDSLRRGLGASKALARMRASHAPAILGSLRHWPLAESSEVAREISLSQLTVGAVVVSDIMTPSGNLLVKSGSEVSEMLLQRLHNFAHGHGVVEPICVTTAPNA